MINAKKEFGVQITSWEIFWNQNEEKLIRYHPIIPFKRPEKIIEHIIKLVALEYGRGDYNLIMENCEHFATLSVCGFTFSTQIDKAGWFIPDKLDIAKEIKRHDETFDKFSLEELTENQVQYTTQIEQPSK